MSTQSPIPYLDDPRLPANMPMIPYALRPPVMTAPPVIPAGQNNPMPPELAPGNEEALPRIPMAGAPANLLRMPGETVKSGAMADRDARLAYDQGELSKINAPHDGQPGSKHPGTFGKILHGAAVAGNILGDALAPGAMMLAPGTDWHNAIERNHLNTDIEDVHDADSKDVEQQEQQRVQQATERHEDAETGLEDKQAAALSAPSFEIHDTDAGPLLVNKRDGSAQHLSVDGQPVGEKLKLTYQTVEGPDGPHTYGVDEKGNKVVDLGKHYERPMVNVDSGRQFQENERGRGLLDKAEQNYRTAHQGAETMRDMLASADAGNKMSAQMLPLEGALAITTAQGVHRINRTEVDQFSGGGSLYDRIASELSKQSAGQPIDASVRADIHKLTDLQEKAAYQNYKGAFDSATKRYGLKDETPLDAPGGGGHQIKIGNELYTYNGSGDTADLKNYTKATGGR